MELETMFVDQRWNILSQLSGEKQSPLQLAEKLNTSMANISQQLRLLEASELVQKQKIKNRDKGKPRTLFSLTDDYAYLVSAMKDFADKRLLKVTDHDKVILRIWFLDDPTLHIEVERLYWSIEPFLNSVDLFAVDQDSKQVVLVTDDSQVSEEVKHSELTVQILSTKQAQRAVERKTQPFTSDSLLIIFDKKDYMNGGEALITSS